MRRRLAGTRLCGGLLALLTLGACGHDELEAMPTELATSADARQRLSSLTDLDERVARVAQRLSDANADLCPTVRLSAGWALHAAGQYSQELRPVAEARFGLEGDLPGVVAVPPDSAAAAAGVRRGDLILAVGDDTLEPGAVRGPPAFDGLAANLRRLDLALSRGPVMLTVRRDGDVRQIELEPRLSCGYDVQLNPSDELNARADGRRLFISTAMAGFTTSDDELAVILGHELAHHVLRHRSWDESGGSGRRANPAAGQPESRNAEQQADRVGLFLAARAGYDPAVAPVYWRRFGASNGWARYPQFRHGSAGARAVALEAVQAEIETLRREGKPILP